MEYPRLLVISNNSFSKSNSNGRTLGSLLMGWPKDRIAQFCISSDGADFDVCENYFCITDGDVLRSTLTLRSVKRRDLRGRIKIDSNSKDGHVKFRKTTVRMVARNFGWKLGLWRSTEFSVWLRECNPEIVLLQGGESYFMYDIAMKISNHFNSKLAIFNTEGYYFFKKDYFPSDGSLGRILFPFYQRTFQKHFNRFMKRCTGQIYGNEFLRRDYDKVFKNTNSKVIYTGSSIAFNPQKSVTALPQFSYFGNLGFNRPQALKDVALTLAAINPTYKLDVYGFAKSGEMENDLKSCSAIRFHGAVPYNEVLKIIEQSDFLIHAESQDSKFAESLRYGFSTKIADCVSSGKLFVLYSSPDIACGRYIRESKAGIFAADIQTLKSKITEVMMSEEKRLHILANARNVAQWNHSPKRNSKEMHSYLIAIANEKF